MAVLNAEMKRVVSEQKLGFVATVDAGGAPNVSPKGTFLVLDDEHIMFGEMRSPNTVKNIAGNSAVEVNFVDPIVRKGIRVKGDAHYVARGSTEYAEHLPAFEAGWGDLCERFNGIVIIAVNKAAPLITPAYDAGSTEEELRTQWLGYFTTLHAPTVSTSSSGLTR